MSDQSARATAVNVLGGRQVRVHFTDGLVRDIDLTPWLWGPVFASIRDDDATFSAVEVDLQLGTLVWPNGADIDPDVLHGDYAPADPNTAAA